MRLSITLLLLLLIGIFSSCKKDPSLYPDPAPPAPQQWTMVYKLVNQSPTDSIQAWGIDAYTYYPKANITNYSAHQFSFGEKYLMYRDTAVLRINDPQYDQPVYPGCTKQMGIVVFLGGKQGIAVKKKFYLQRDTIRVAKDSVSYFHWPNDTLIATSY